MKICLLALVVALFSALANAAPSYTDFFVQPTGSNLNAGSTLSDTPVVESTNGDWGNAAANRFTAASGTPFSGVAVGDWASIYVDGASVTALVARVTAVNGGGSSIDLSTTARAGTAPASSASGRTCRIGGAWAGMSGTVTFPFNFAREDLVNASGHSTRVFFKGTYNLTTTIAHGLNGPVIFEGYSTTPGDGGMATIDGGNSGTYYKLLYLTGDETPSLVTIGFHNFIFQNNGGSGTGEYGVHCLTGQVHFWKCVFRDFGGTGLRMQGPGMIESCEFYGNNESNRSNHGGVELISAGAILKNTVSHHNLGSNSDGVLVTTKAHVLYSVSWGNGRHGFRFGSAPVSSSLQHVDAYANGGSGVSFGAGGTIVIENSNFVDNGGYGIDWGGFTFLGIAANNGFGSGSLANTSGDMSTSKGIEIVDTVNYPAGELPWSGANSGNFNITHPMAKNAGRGRFLYTSGTPLTLGTPDIGAAQSVDTVNTDPSVSISSPSNGTTTDSPVNFTGVATDTEDGTISASIEWSSSIDGVLGTGATLSSVALTPGTHTITASIEDSGGLTDSATITLTINAPGTNGTLNVQTTEAASVIIQ